MEGQIQEADKVWLFNFRQTINSECDPLEFAENAITYDPYPTNTRQCSQNKHFHADKSQHSSYKEFKCTGLRILDVSSVYSLGKNAFITCSDVKINLYKIYIYLTEAISRLKNMEDDNSTERCKECISELNFLLRRFNGYIKMCMRLSEDVNHMHLKKSKSESPNVTTSNQFNKFREITSKFKVDQSELNKLFETDSDELKSKDSKHCSQESLTLLWSFYRDAGCSEVFSLLCYTLFTASPMSYKAILENFEPCIRSHLKENWKVLLSYIPLSFEFKDYQFVFESILFESCNSGTTHSSSSVNTTNNNTCYNYDESLLSSFIDWCLWRIFLIVKYTNSSYFLFIRFIKNMSKLLSETETTEKIQSKLQLFNFLKFIVKQYFIYKSLNTSVSYSENLNNSIHDIKGGELGDHMSFFEYLDLKASKKLSLFCEFEVSQSNQECECEEQYKDKHKIYKFCLHCKTNNLSNKLKSFFVLISPATEVVTTPRLQGRTSDGNEYTKLTSSEGPDRDGLENEYVALNEDFGDFYASLLSSYNSGLNDYLSGISESFMKELNARSFEILYSLSTVLLETGFRNNLFSLFLEIIYSGTCNYNFLENYFLIKSTFNLITADPELNDPNDTFDTRNTLFRLLKYFDVNRDVSNSAYSGYKKLSSNLAKNLKNQNGNRLNRHPDDNGSEDLFLSVETLLSCINCQLDFLEILLNILSLVNVEGASVPTITPLDLMLSLVSDEHFLVLLQKILVFIMDLSMDPLEFSNCMFELINLSNYISSVDIDSIHSMFFYTIASKNNLNYLNQQLQLWYKNTSSLGVVREGGNVEGGRECAFLNRTLNCVFNVVYRMDLSCNINIFHLLVNYCKFVPQNNKFYRTQWYLEPMSIYPVIGLYVNYVNSNSNLRSILNEERVNDDKNEGNNSVIRECSDKLNMLVVLSKVYKSILLFDCYNLVIRQGHKSLDYKHYESNNLIDMALSTLLSLLNESGSEVGNNEAGAGNEVHERGEGILMLVFRCILEHVSSNRLYTTQLFDDLKVAIGQLCPKDMTGTLVNLVNILLDVTQNANLENKNYLKLEGKNEALRGLCVNVLVILYTGISNLLIISNLIQFCVCSQLSKSMTFLYNNLMVRSVQARTNQRMDDNWNYLDDADRNERNTFPNFYDDNQDTWDEYVDLEEQRTDLDINELFDYGEDYQVDREVSYDDKYFRKNILNMLDLNRYEKTGVKQSIGKFANKFGTNVATGFITAIERAEGELLNIAKKTNKFEMLKDKLFYQKKQQNLEKSMYTPILNYFESTVLFHLNIYDQEGESMNELLQYRNLKEITVSRLVALDADMACLMLMENCSYLCNDIFLREMQHVFNENELRNVHRFLERLTAYLVHANWASGVVEKITNVKNFLNLFRDFPENLSISVSSFIFNRDYRLNLFKTIPSYVAVNLQLVQDIYGSLRMFYSKQICERQKLSPEAGTSLDGLQEYLFGEISVGDDLTKTADDGAKAGTIQGAHFTNFDEMDEYVEVLFSVYTEIFLDDFNIQSFLQLEPLFLLNHEKYLCFLLKLYYNLTNSPAVGTPSSQGGYSLRSYTSYTSISSHNSSPDSTDKLLVNNSRLIMVRRCIYNFLRVYPEFGDSFNVLYRADSLDMIKFLETVFSNIPDFDLSLVDNFELFKQRLINVLTFDNFFFIADSVQILDSAFSSAIYRKLERGLRPHSDEIVDCTRLLFEYDLSNNTL